MAALTIAQLRAKGVNPASTDKHGFPGDVILDYEIDGSKQAVAATDTVDFFEIPALAGMIVKAAAVTVVRPGTASGALAIQIGGTSVTGLTAWATDAAAGTKLVKLATAANTVVNTGSASYVRILQSTAGLGSGKLRIRVFGTLLEAPSATPV
jgi:hypothetical protein